MLLLAVQRVSYLQIQAIHLRDVVHLILLVQLSVVVFNRCLIAPELVHN